MLQHFNEKILDILMSGLYLNCLLYSCKCVYCVDILTSNASLFFHVSLSTILFVRTYLELFKANTA